MKTKGRQGTNFSLTVFLICGAVEDNPKGSSRADEGKRRARRLSCSHLRRIHREYGMNISLGISEEAGRMTPRLDLRGSDVDGSLRHEFGVQGVYLIRRIALEIKLDGLSFANFPKRRIAVGILGHQRLRANGQSHPLISEFYVMILFYDDIESQYILVKSGQAGDIVS